MCCVRCAVCSLQSAGCSFWTRRQLNCIERNRTGVEVAGLHDWWDWMGLGSNSRREARPRWPLARLGEGGTAAGGLAGPRCGAGVQMCSCGWGTTDSTIVPAGDGLLEVVIKWSLSCARPCSSVGARLVLGWVMDEKSQAHLSSAGIWARCDCGNSPRRSGRETVKLRAGTTGNHTRPQQPRVIRATWPQAMLPRSLNRCWAEGRGR